MRIAYLTSRLPFPPVGGDRMRVYYTLRHLLQSHEVTLYTAGASVRLGRAEEHSGLQGLRQKVFPMGKLSYALNGAKALGSSLPVQVKLYKNGHLARALEEDIQSGAVDLLFVHLVRMAEYARPYAGIPRILDMADSIYLHYQRMPRFGWTPHWFGTRLDRNRMRQYETDVTRWFDSVLVHTDEDLEWIRHESGAANLVKSPMGVDTDEFAFCNQAAEPNLIAYCGKLDYLPNADAAAYFAEEILPLVRREVPGARFSVIGFNPPRKVRELERRPGVEIRANVPDVRPEVSRATVSVAPIRFGAGIQNKVLQSLALGVPVVATPLAARPFGPESPVLEAQNRKDFASHVVQVLRDADYRAKLAWAGRRIVEERFGWDRVMAPVDHAIEAAFARGAQELAASRM